MLPGRPRSELPNAWQHFAAEQFQRAHHAFRVAGAWILERQIDHAGADLFAALAQLFDHAIRTAAEADREHATDVRGATFAGDVARDVGTDQRITQAGSH